MTAQPHETNQAHATQAHTTHGHAHAAPRDLRIGVILGGRSSEHEVSLSSARNVIHALREAGYQVTTIGISPEGRWLTGGDPVAQLTATQAASTDPARADIRLSQKGWDLLPRHTEDGAALADIDVIFPVLHGPFGEDGTIQGLLEMANLPYVGCGVLTSAVAMDKAIAKRLLAAEGILQTRSQLIERHKWRNGTPSHAEQENSQSAATFTGSSVATGPVMDDAVNTICHQIETTFGYPVFVKPANLGSSIGVSKARTRAELVAAIDLAAEYDRKILVEEAVPHAREIEVSVLGNHAPIASIPGEVIPGHEFYDYEAKYIDDSSSLIIPAELDTEQVTQVQEMALAAFRALDAEGLARVDFLMNAQTGEFYLNEINTMPGFTRSSMYPKLWEASGIPYPELVHRLVQLALERYDERSRNRTTR